MNTQWISRRFGHRATTRIRGSGERMIPRNDQVPGGTSAGWRRLSVLVVCLGLSGCTYSGGELLYAMGLARGELIEAKFRLTEGTILILVDDPSQSVDWPPVARHLFNDIAQELLKNDAAKKIVPHQTIEHLRQSVPNFEKRGCRELGELAGAEEVLWIEVQDFLASEQIYDVTAAAFFNVNVKVISALEKTSRSRVRLWPTSPQGHLVTTSLSGSEAAMAKSRDGIAKELANRLAEKIAKLFYDHRLDDFEREE